MAKEVVEKVITITKRCLEFPETVEIGIEDDLKEMGMNSIGLIKIIVSFEAEFGISFSDSKLNYSTFTNLKNLLGDLLDIS
jgi:acyl carrier protein